MTSSSPPAHSLRSPKGQTEEAYPGEFMTHRAQRTTASGLGGMVVPPSYLCLSHEITPLFRTNKKGERQSDTFLRGDDGALYDIGQVIQRIAREAQKSLCSRVWLEDYKKVSIFSADGKTAARTFRVVDGKTLGFHFKDVLAGLLFPKVGVEYYARKDNGEHYVTKGTTRNEEVRFFNISSPYTNLQKSMMEKRGERLVAHQAQLKAKESVQSASVSQKLKVYRVTDRGDLGLIKDADLSEALLKDLSSLASQKNNPQLLFESSDRTCKSKLVLSYSEDGLEDSRTFYFEDRNMLSVFQVGLFSVLHNEKMQRITIGGNETSDCRIIFRDAIDKVALL